MHDAAYAWLDKQTASYRDHPIDVLELGSRNVNGSPRTLPGLNRAFYIGVDLEPGPGVDVVADAAQFVWPVPFHLVICAEVFEHTPWWPTIVFNAYDQLNRNQTFLVTAAMRPRAPHSATDGHLLADDETEYYQNIDRPALEDALRGAPFTSWEIEQHPDRGDIYAACVR